MKEDDERGLLAYEMSCYRNMLRARWRDKVSNDNIRQKVDRKETIMDIIRRRKLLLFGHICRMPDDRLVKTVLLGSVDGIRWRGRPPKKWTDNITDWTLNCHCVKLFGCHKTVLHVTRQYLASTVSNQGTRRRRPYPTSIQPNTRNVLPLALDC